MSSKFDIVKNFYERGLWNIDRVYNAVEKEWITTEEFEEIIDISYDSYKQN